MPTEISSEHYEPTPFKISGSMTVREWKDYLLGLKQFFTYTESLDFHERNAVEAEIMFVENLIAISKKIKPSVK